MKNIQHIHTMTPEELLEYLCEHPKEVMNNTNAQTLIQNRISVLNNRIRRAQSLFKALTEEDPS